MAVYIPGPDCFAAKIPINYQSRCVFHQLKCSSAMPLRFAFLAAILSMISACAHVVDDRIQDFTLLTPGAHGALCYVYVDKFKYRMDPPQTITIGKSREELRIDCMAPGNRRQEMFIEPVIQTSTHGNAFFGAIPGVAWDFASEAMYKYPEIVEVNFTRMPARMEDMPAQNNPDVRQPETFRLEEFGPSSPRINADRNNQQTVIRKRERPGARTGYQDFIMPEDTTGMSGDKGDLDTVIENLNMNPAGPPDSVPETAPPGSPVDILSGPPAR